MSEKPLPLVGGKIAKQVLQAPTFVLRNLRESIEAVQTRNSEDWVALAREVFERVDGDSTGTLDRDEVPRS